MKKEDFDRLKALCQENDFELLNVDHEDNEKYFVIAKKEDPWDGVEFGRYKFPNHRQVSSFKVKSISEQMLTTEGGYELFKGNCNPIDESDYINQLKKEAFERHDNKLRSDKIDDSMMDGGRIHYGYNSDDEPFTYRKDTDTLYWCGIPVYQSGRWATRVKERIEVEYGHYSLPFDPKYILALHFSIDDPNRMNDDAGKFMASQLEAYLNIKDCETSINGEIVSIHIKPKKGADLSKVAEKAQELANLCSD